jgi:putative sigma-54 modulation protein
MQINFTGHQLEVTDALRSFTTEKIQKLQRHFERILKVHVTFVIEKLAHIAEATIHIPGNDVHARSSSDMDMYSAVDLLVDKLDRQLIKLKEKEETR